MTNRRPDNIILENEDTELVDLAVKDSTTSIAKSKEHKPNNEPLELEWANFMNDMLYTPAQDCDHLSETKNLISNLNFDDITNLNNEKWDDILEPQLKSNIDQDGNVEIVDYKKCVNCKINGIINGNIIICEQCGLERSWNHQEETYSMTIDQNYNTSNNSFMSFKIVGSNYYCYNRSYLKTCANYSSFRSNSNRKEIMNRIFQYEGNKPPINIINVAIDLFNQIKVAGYVCRGNGKLGCMAATLFYACVMNNLTRTPREIATIMNIEERFLSQGDRFLQELNELGVISIPTNFKPIGDYLDQFFPLLGIPVKYKPFIIHLISRAEKKHLHIKNESRTTTKCIGAIYLLCQRIPSLKHIKKETISRECNNISKSTFLKYYNLLTTNYIILRKSFRKYKISMPIEWKKSK